MFNVVKKTYLEFAKHRFLIRQLIINELKARYYTSFLGILWSVLVPLSTLAIYTVVFSVFLRARWENTGNLPYAFILFAALIPFNVFSDVVNRSPGLVLSHPNYVKKVVFPLHILPIVALGVAWVDSLISLVLLFLGMLFLSHTVSLYILLLPLAYLPLLLVSLGVSWFLAATGVYIRDTGPTVNIITRLWFFLTPIVYPLETIPPRYALWIKFNPLTSIVEGFRNILLFSKPLPWVDWGIWMIVGLIVSIAGYVWFNLTRKGFADVL